MKHHQYNPNFPFVLEPIEFDKNTEKDLLQYCLGGTLYMPGTKKITEKILQKKTPGLTSMVMCFEDAIQEKDLGAAEENVLEHLTALSSAVNRKETSIGDIPLTFVRIRDLKQFKRFSDRLSPEQAEMLTGFVFPKYYSSNAFYYLDHLRQLNHAFGKKLYGMPILEGTTLAYIEMRVEELGKLKNVMEPFEDLILNIRVGGTDFSSIFGVRRGINYSIYDILTVRDCLAGILNFFNRAESPYVISAPVWEYFLADKEEDLQLLLAENIHHSLLQRNSILNDAIDGLLREVILDEANGFIGKTIIHPSHLRFVNAMQAVTKEVYDDANQIMNAGDGVIKSVSANKMNEVNPHRNWALRVLRRAQVFGVIENQASFISLMSGKG